MVEVVDDKVRQGIIKKLRSVAEKKGIKLKLGSELSSFVRIPSGLPQLDSIGGPVLGRFIVIYGVEGSAKTTMCCRWLAAAQREYPEKLVLLVESEDKFDVNWAAIQGVDIENLLVVQGEKTLEDYCDSLRDLVKEGVISLCVVDSISAMTPQAYFDKEAKGEMMERNHIGQDATKIQQFIKITKGDFFEHNTACVIVGQARTHGIGSMYTHIGLSGGHMLKHMAMQIWQFNPLNGATEVSHKMVDIDGRKVKVLEYFHVKATLQKDTGPNVGQAAYLKFIPGVGFDDMEAWIRAGITYGIIDQTSAAWFVWTDSSGEQNKLQGRNKVVDYFKQEDTERQRLMTLVVEAYNTQKLENSIEKEDNDQEEGERES